MLIVMLLWAALVAASATILLASAARAVEAEKEIELVAAGEAIVAAIASYYRASPGSEKELPTSLEALLVDRRKLYVERHLRSIPVDPFTRADDWALISAEPASLSARPAEGAPGEHPQRAIVGVCSRHRSGNGCQGRGPPDTHGAAQARSQRCFRLITSVHQ